MANVSNVANSVTVPTIVSLAIFTTETYNGFHLCVETQMQHV